MSILIKYRKLFKNHPSFLSLLDFLSVILMVYALGILFRLDEAKNWEIIIFLSVGSSLFWSFLAPGSLELIKDYYNSLIDNKSCLNKSLDLLTLLCAIFFLIMSFFIFISPYIGKVKYILSIELVHQHISQDIINYFNGVNSFPIWAFIISYLTIHFTSFKEEHLR